MSKNLIPEIANLLCVEVGEEFKIKVNDEREKNYEDLTYLFTESQGLVTPNENYCATVISNLVLIRLLRGEYSVVKLPWKPQYNDKYWTYSAKTFRVTKSYWREEAYDYANLKCGMVFRTETEAIEARPQVYRELTGAEWKDE